MIEQERMKLDTDSLKQKWIAQYLECEPISEALKHVYENRWVRFHSLPNSKRYPENESEYEIVLERHSTILKELNPGDSLFVITSEWTEVPDPTAKQRWPKRSEIEPNAVHWQTIQEEEPQTYRQVYVSKKPWRSRVSDKLLRARANDEIGGVIIAPEDLRWLYAPYDGGADVILPTQKERDALKQHHPTWLSDRPDGL